MTWPKYGATPGSGARFAAELEMGFGDDLCGPTNGPAIKRFAAASIGVARLMKLLWLSSVTQYRYSARPVSKY